MGITGREAVEAGVDQALGPPPPSAVHPGTPLPPEPVQNSEEGRSRRGGPLGRLNVVLGMAHDEEQREIHAMRSAALWGVSLIVVGFIFLILVCTGAYPTSTANLKSLDIYGDYIAQFTLSMVAGIMSFAAAVYARRALRAGRANSTVPHQIAFLLALLIALAIIGMSIYLDVTVNNFESSMWWVWLILVLIVLQRGFFAIACAFSISTLRLAASCNGEAGSGSYGGDAVAADEGKAFDGASSVAEVV